MCLGTYHILEAELRTGSKCIFGKIRAFTIFALDPKTINHSSAQFIGSSVEVEDVNKMFNTLSKSMLGRGGAKLYAVQLECCNKIT